MPVCSTCGFQSERAFRFCPECGAEQAATSDEQRKTVTVLFCDLTGSTALGETLDPERLRALLARYFERMKAIVERHGGTVEKFIGDAVMAVFGVPHVHEDDALRALRAAVEMRDALPELGLQGRIGVTTGEVVTGTQERLATGDAVNVAARLEQAAQPGEVLIGQPTLAFVRDAIDVEPVEPLDLKGKAEPVAASRVLRVLDAPPERRQTPFVGRESELAMLQQAWDRSRGEQRCELCTVVGDAGVGKSRLVTEFLSATDALVVRGRCLPYGEGITYWPVVEVLKQLDVTPPDEAAATAIRALLGESDFASSPDEIAWAFRKTLEDAAAERPLVVVFDDLQWGEETFRDLIEHLALLSSGASILLLCIARPELVDQRPAWPIALRLDPLTDDEVDDLIPGGISQHLREKIARAAGGNPLFIEEMLAMAGDADGDVAVPPTLHALLATRLDQLDPAERIVLERGAIEGEVFHRGAVQALAPDGTQVTPRLAALVRKDLIRPERSQLEGEDGFRFRHLLIRDAAYEALPKATRADLHERFATWLQDRGTELVELDEILGYHLERACAYRDELGMLVDERLADGARRRLTAAGRRGQLRADYGAAASLLERAAAVVPAGELDLALEIDLVEARFWGGQTDDALRRADSIVERATGAGDQIGELCGRLQAGIVRVYLEPERAAERLSALVQQSLPVFEAAGHDLGRYIAYHALGEATFEHAKTDAALDAYERAAAHARRAGVQQEFLDWRGTCRFYGTTPVSGVLAWLNEQRPRPGLDHWLHAYRALSLAMLGRADEGRAILEAARSELAERGGGIRLAVTTGIESVDFELLAGDPAAAAELGLSGCRMLEEQGEQSFLSTAAGTLARPLYALDRLDEADTWAGRAAEVGSSEDAFTQLLWRQVRAKVLARRGEHPEAERLAREAVAIAEGTDFLNGQADAYADLGEVLLLLGRSREAAEAFEQALARYERKGNLVMTVRTHDRLKAMGEARDPTP